MPRPAESLVKLFNLEPFPQPSLIRTKYPIVFFHGFGMIASFRRQGQLHEIALDLRQRGTLAYAPNVAPYNTVSVRSTMWKQCIEHVLEETGAEAVNIIAHSMGGLDARYVITKRGMHSVVASLTTIATPHHGTPLADWIMEQPERLREWMAELVNRIGDIAMNTEPSNVLQAVDEMRTEFVVSEFNPSVPDHPSVQYWSYAAVAGEGTSTKINPVLIPQNQYIYQHAGLNDGYVPVDSARWGQFLGTIEADHIQQIGIQVLPSTFEAMDFYSSIAQMLEDEGL